MNLYRCIVIYVRITAIYRLAHTKNLNGLEVGRCTWVSGLGSSPRNIFGPRGILAAKITTTTTKMDDPLPSIHPPSVVHVGGDSPPLSPLASNPNTPRGVYGSSRPFDKDDDDDDDNDNDIPTRTPAKMVVPSHFQKGTKHETPFDEPMDGIDSSLRLLTTIDMSNDSQRSRKKTTKPVLDVPTLQHPEQETQDNNNNENTTTTTTSHRAAWRRKRMVRIHEETQDGGGEGDAPHDEFIPTTKTVRRPIHPMGMDVPHDELQHPTDEMMIIQSPSSTNALAGSMVEEEEPPLIQIRQSSTRRASPLTANTSPSKTRPNDAEGPGRIQRTTKTVVKPNLIPPTPDKSSSLGSGGSESPVANPTLDLRSTIDGGINRNALYPGRPSPIKISPISTDPMRAPPMTPPSIVRHSSPDRKSLYSPVPTSLFDAYESDSVRESDDGSNSTGTPESPVVYQNKVALSFLPKQAVAVGCVETALISPDLTPDSQKSRELVKADGMALDTIISDAKYFSDAAAQTLAAAGVAVETFVLGPPKTARTQQELAHEWRRRKRLAKAESDRLRAEQAARELQAGRGSMDSDDVTAVRNNRNDPIKDVVVVVSPEPTENTNKKEGWWLEQELARRDVVASDKEEEEEEDARGDVGGDKRAPKLDLGVVPAFQVDDDDDVPPPPPPPIPQEEEEGEGDEGQHDESIDAALSDVDDDSTSSDSEDEELSPLARARKVLGASEALTPPSFPKEKLPSPNVSFEERPKSPEPGSEERPRSPEPGSEERPEPNSDDRPKSPDPVNKERNLPKVAVLPIIPSKAAQDPTVALQKELGDHVLTHVGDEIMTPKRTDDPDRMIQIGGDLPDLPDLKERKEQKEEEEEEEAVDSDYEKLAFEYANKYSSPGRDKNVRGDDDSLSDDEIYCDNEASSPTGRKEKETAVEPVSPIFIPTLDPLEQKESSVPPEEEESIVRPSGEEEDAGRDVKTPEIRVDTNISMDSTTEGEVSPRDVSELPVTVEDKTTRGPLDSDSVGSFDSDGTEVQSNTKPTMVKALDDINGICKGDVMLSLVNARSAKPEGLVGGDTQVKNAVWRMRSMRRKARGLESNPPSGMATPAAKVSPNRKRSALPVDVDEGRVVGGIKQVKRLELDAVGHLQNDEFEDALELYEDIIYAYTENFTNIEQRRFQQANEESTDFRTYTGNALHNIGIINFLNGDFLEAQSFFQRAAESRKASLGDVHPDYLTSVVKGALCEFALENYSSAHDELERVLQTGKGNCRSVTDFVQIAEILNNLGCLSFMCSEPGTAMRLFTESLEVQNAVLSHSLYGGPVLAANSASLNLSVTRANLAFVHMFFNNYPAALTTFESALMTQQMLLDPSNETLLGTMDHLAAANLLAGNQEKALLMLHRMLRIQEEAFGVHDERWNATRLKIEVVKENAPNLPQPSATNMLVQPATTTPSESSAVQAPRPNQNELSSSQREPKRKSVPKAVLQKLNPRRKKKEVTQ